MNDGKRTQQRRRKRSSAVQAPILAPLLTKLAASIAVAGFVGILIVSDRMFPDLLSSVPFVTRALLQTIAITFIALSIIAVWMLRPLVADRRRLQAKFSEINESMMEAISEREDLARQLTVRTSELERHINEIDFNNKMIEKQAADTVEIAEQLAWQKQQIEHLANHDLLTNLPNRRQFQNALARSIDMARDTNTSVGVLFVDLDKFKLVNDRLGHDAGDELLKDVANRLRNVVRQTDIIARLGGDEFAIIANGVRGVKDRALTEFAERVRLALVIDINVDDEVIPVRATLGVAVYPDDAQDSTDLLRFADEAMYRAKREGRNRIIYFNALAAAQPEQSAPSRAS